MNASQLHQEIVSYCHLHADEAIVKKYAIYFKDGISGYNAYGISTELLKEKVKEISEKETFNMELLLETAPLLLQTGKYEETIFLLLLTEKKIKKLKAENFDEISKWFDFGIVNWAHCDSFCNKILPWFFLQQLVPLSRLTEWQISSHKFQRRAVPVLLIKLLKSTTDYSAFFQLIDPLMLDNERVVHQGLGWFLREAWKKQPAQTELFLMRWKDHTARLIIQYATEKMTQADRQTFKKSK